MRYLEVLRSKVAYRDGLIFNRDRAGPATDVRSSQGDGFEALPTANAAAQTSSRRGHGTDRQAVREGRVPQTQVGRP